MTFRRRVSRHWTGRRYFRDRQSIQVEAIRSNHAAIESAGCGFTDVAAVTRRKENASPDLSNRVGASGSRI